MKNKIHYIIIPKIKWKEKFRFLCILFYPFLFTFTFQRARFLSKVFFLSVSLDHSLRFSLEYRNSFFESHVLYCVLLTTSNVVLSPCQDTNTITSPIPFEKKHYDRALYKLTIKACNFIGLIVSTLQHLIVMGSSKNHLDSQFLSNLHFIIPSFSNLIA